MPVLGITGTGGAGKSLAHRRADPAPAPRPGRRAAHRRDLDRPVAPQERRRAARRPHPHERDRPVERRPARLHALARHARLRQRDLRRRCPTCIAAVQGRPASTWSIVETSGIGQGDAAIVPLVDVPLYVMTPEFGAASQLEKIDMLDFAEFVAINKFDRKGAADALRDVRQAGAAQPRGLRQAARRDAGVRHHGQPLQRRRRDRAVPGAASRAWPTLGLPLAGRPAAARSTTRHSTHQTPIVPPARARYLAEIADTVRGYKRTRASRRTLAREVQQLRASRAHAAEAASPTRAPRRRGGARPGRRSARRGSTPTRSSCSRCGRSMQKRLRRRRVRGEDPRQGDPHRAHPHHAVGHQDPQGGAAALRGPRRDPAAG